MLSTVWNPQRGSRSYIKKRRGKKEIEVRRRSKGRIKGREIDLVSALFPKCVCSLEHPQRFTELG